MLVILDTNIIFHDFRFEGTQSLMLLEACAIKDKTGMQLGLPSVILGEVKRRYRRELEAHSLNVARLLRMGQNLVGELSYAVNKDTLEQYIENYVLLIENLTKKVGIQDLGYPNISIQTLVERDFSGRKPFGSRQAIGDQENQDKKPDKDDLSVYRDYLIWETIVQVLQDTDEEVAFVTENHYDFASSPKKRNLVHPELLHDLAQQEIETTRLTLYNSLAEFNERITRPALNKVKIYPDYLLDYNSDFSRQLLDEVKDMLENLRLDNAKIGLRTEYEDPRITWVEELQYFKVTDLRSATDNLLFVSVEVDALSTIVTFVRQQVWIGILEDDKEKEELLYWDEDWNDTYVKAALLRPIHLFLKLTVDGKTKHIEEIEAQPLTPDGTFRHITMRQQEYP